MAIVFLGLYKININKTCVYKRKLIKNNGLLQTKCDKMLRNGKINNEKKTHKKNVDVFKHFSLVFLINDYQTETQKYKCFEDNLKHLKIKGKANQHNKLKIIFKKN